MTYVDAVGRSYTTEAHWDQRRQAFTHTTVTEGDAVRVPMTIAVQSAVLPHHGEPKP